MSYMWYTCFGAVVTILIALILTPVFGHNRAKDIDPSLITPYIRNRIKYDEEKDAEKVVSKFYLFKIFLLYFKKALIFYII